MRQFFNTLELNIWIFNILFKSEGKKRPEEIIVNLEKIYIFIGFQFLNIENSYNMRHFHYKY